MNSTILTGRPTADPEMKYTPSGTAVVTFCLAVGRQFKNAAGEYETDFVDVVAWRGTAEYLSNYVTKGMLIGVDGRIQTRTYEKDGQKRKVVEVVAESVQILAKSGKSERSESNGEHDPFAGE